MKNFLKKFVVFLGIVTVISATLSTVLNNSTVAADGNRIDGSSCEYFLGMTAWDCGFQSMEGNQDALVSNIALIATNVLSDITVIASYLVIGYVMYGGYLYMFSSGDAGRVMAGKKTLQHAFIGLAIVMSAYAIFGAIRIALIGNGGNLGECNPTTGGCVTAGDMVTNLIHWFAGVAGAVSAIFVVVGGWGYITASGDPSKLQKAKSTILYALIGLVVVALTEVLTAFISNLIREANKTEETSYHIETQITNNDKELT